MKITTVQCFCDRCGVELECEPLQDYGVLHKLNGLGQRDSHVKVTIQYQQCDTVYFDCSMLCNKCKIEALEEVLKKLKERSERNG